MFSYAATIGRNFSPTHPLPGLQNKPMSLSAWTRFVEDVEADMRTAIEPNNAAPVTVEIHRGTGVWEGVTEESAKVAVLADKPVSPVGMTVLRGLLSQLAREYGQDAIALTVGSSELLPEPETATVAFSVEAEDRFARNKAMIAAYQS